MLTLPQAVQPVPCIISLHQFIVFSPCAHIVHEPLNNQHLISHAADCDLQGAEIQRHQAADFKLTCSQCGKGRGWGVFYACALLIRGTLPRRLLGHCHLLLRYLPHKTPNSIDYASLITNLQYSLITTGNRPRHAKCRVFKNNTSQGAKLCHWKDVKHDACIT